MIAYIRSFRSIHGDAILCVQSIEPPTQNIFALYIRKRFRKYLRMMMMLGISCHAVSNSMNWIARKQRVIAVEFQISMTAECQWNYVNRKYYYLTWDFYHDMRQSMNASLLEYIAYRINFYYTWMSELKKATNNKSWLCIYHIQLSISHLSSSMG